MHYGAAASDHISHSLTEAWSVQVYKGKKTDGQEVAVKVLHDTDKTRLDMFTKVGSANCWSVHVC